MQVSDPYPGLSFESRIWNHCIWERWSCREMCSFWRKRGIRTSKQKQVSYDSLVTLRRTFIAHRTTLLQLLPGRHTGCMCPGCTIVPLLPKTPMLWSAAAHRALSQDICCNMHKSWEHVSELCFCSSLWNRLCVQPGPLRIASYLPHREAPISRMFFHAHALRTQAENTKYSDL